MLDFGSIFFWTTQFDLGHLAQDVCCVCVGVYCVCVCVSVSVAGHKKRNGTKKNRKTLAFFTLCLLPSGFHYVGPVALVVTIFCFVFVLCLDDQKKL